MRRKEALLQGILHAAERPVAIESAARATEKMLIDVSCEQADVPLIVIGEPEPESELELEQHGDGIGFLAGGAAGAPQAHLPLRSRQRAAGRQQPEKRLLQGGEACGLTKEIGLADGEMPGQDRELWRWDRPIEQRDHIAAGIPETGFGGGRLERARQQAVAIFSEDE